MFIANRFNQKCSLAICAAAAIATFSTISLTSCKKLDEAESASDSSSNIAESALSAASGAASDTENDSLGSSSVHLQSGHPQSEDLDGVDGIANAQAYSAISPLATCSLAGVRSACSGAVMTIDFNGCTITGSSNISLKLSGGWTNTYNSSSTCTTATTSPLPSGGSVVRTSPTGFVNTLMSTALAGANVTTDTAAHTAWDGTSIPSTGVEVSNSSGTRTITINGLHRVLKGPRGTTWFDHSITTPTSLTVSGTRAGGNRAISSGSVRVYHNRARYTATNTFNNVQWTSSTCCYPTSGNITTSLTGSVTGTTVLTFSSTCGEASFTDRDGASQTVTLTQCQ